MKTKLTPSMIVEELDKYIISQDEAKKSVAISLRNRMRRKLISDPELKKEITPKNIILMGSTGIGKTEIARRLAKIADAPFIKVEATKYTEIGYVGNDVESIIKDLVNIAMKNVIEKKREELSKEIYFNVLEKIAKIYKPYDSLNDDEKEKIIERLNSGELNDIEIEITEEKKSHPQIIEVIQGKDNVDDIKDIFSNIIENVGYKGKNDKKVKMKISKAIKHILYNDVEEIIENSDFTSEVIEKVEEDGIVFIDEIDKIVERDDSSRGEVSRQGVQRDILPIVEGCTVYTKYGPVKTDHILFIAAGAFSQASPKDIMPELQGRFPVRVKLKNLEKSDLIKILTKVKYNLITQYQELLAQDNVELSFSKSAIEGIADVAFLLNEKIENIGARRLHTVLETLLRDIMYEAPYSEPKKLVIDKKYITKIFKDEYEEENLDKFIL